MSWATVVVSYSGGGGTVYEWKLRKWRDDRKGDGFCVVCAGPRTRRTPAFS